jgi:hypothetical protein
MPLIFHVSTLIKNKRKVCKVILWAQPNLVVLLLRKGAKWIFANNF